MVFLSAAIAPAVTAIAVANDYIASGTADGEIIEARPGETLPVFICSGHYSMLCGLATHPTQNLFATAAFDKSVRYVDVVRLL